MIGTFDQGIMARPLPSSPSRGRLPICSLRSFSAGTPIAGFVRT